VDELDLDYDDDLTQEAAEFARVHKAQGGDGSTGSTGQSSSVVDHPATVPLDKSLEEAIRIAREIYGETNSKHSEAFCHWAQDILAGCMSVKESKALLELLHEDKDIFSARWRVAYLNGQEEVADRLHARWMTVFCAANVIRAVINKFKGREYAMWIDRAIYRASMTENDVKSLP